MHFCSMAVTVLAQSVPLLAVGNLAGWKKRETRSWLKRRLLRDALLVGVNDKNGVSFERRVEVHGKQDNVLEKERSGSARLAQDGASSEVPSDSDDGEASVECDPLSKVSDSGIFGCGMDSYCVESEKSELGGLCVAAKNAPSISRALQEEEVPSCVAGTDESGNTCDCSQFNNTSGVGNFTCISDYCYGTTCVPRDYSVTYNADGSYYTEGCYEVGLSVMGVESYCFSFRSPAECEIKVNGIVCNSCGLDQETCPATSEEANTFDCTNTVLNMEGNMCDTGPLSALLLLIPGVETTVPGETGAPSDLGLETTVPDETTVPGETAVPDETAVPGETGAPVASSETVMPTTSPPPNTSSIETLSPDASSGSSHASKVTIAVSAAAAAWMASFGI